MHTLGNQVTPQPGAAALAVPRLPHRSREASAWLSSGPDSRHTQATHWHTDWEAGAQGLILDAQQTCCVTLDKGLTLSGLQPHL